MKKLALIFISLTAAVICAACTDKIPDEPTSTMSEVVQSSEEKTEKYQIALITDTDGLQNSDTLRVWQGVVTYGDSTAHNYKYYTADNLSTASGIMAVNNAVESGADVVIFPSEKYKYIAYTAQSQFPDMNFVLVGAMPTEEGEGSAPDISIDKNVHCIYFKEEQVGYLAGYCAVMDGRKSLAYIGDINDEANMRYAYGFIKGADDAAVNKIAGDVTVKYIFTDSDKTNAQKAAEALYSEGVQTFFACNENICEGISAAAENADLKMITGGFVSKSFGDVQLASVVCGVNDAVEFSLSAFYGNGGAWTESAAGKALRFGIENGCISLESDSQTWKFSNIDESTVENIINKFINNEVSISYDTSEPVKTRRIKYSEFLLTSEETTALD